MLSIKKIIIKILTKLLELSTNYIVEQGTSGDWTYRKWSNGAAECWYRHKFTDSLGLTQSKANLVYTNDTWAQRIIDYPPNLFKGQAPTVIASTQTSGYSLIQVSDSFSSLDNCYIRVWCPVTSTVDRIEVCLYAKGYWK